MKRILRLDGLSDVVIEIFDPVLDEDTDGHYVCIFNVTGLSKVLVDSAMGVDAIQANYHALQMIGNRLYTINEYKDKRLSWNMAVQEGDLGFPTAA